MEIDFSERVEPPLENWPHLKTTSRTFNSTQFVADLDRAKAFYQGVLGFKTYLDHRGPSATSGEHVLGLSREAMTSIMREVRIVSTQENNEGSVEQLEVENYTGRDFSDRARPSHLGNLMLRYRVPYIDGLVDYLSSKDVPLEYTPIITTLAPYGNEKLLAITRLMGYGLSVTK